MDSEKLRGSSQYRLLNLITSIAPSSVLKDLAIHEDLMKPIDHIAGARLLREQGVEKMFRLGNTPPPWKNATRLYLIPAIYSVAETIAQHLKSENLGRVEYHVIVVPKILGVIHSLFEAHGVLDNAMFHSYSWDFIPLDTSLISLEFHHFLKDCFVKNDNSLLGCIAKAVMSLECLVGKIPSVVTMGEKSHKVHSLLETWHNEIRPSLPSETEFSHLVILDRNVDFVTLLLTQLTYEGVLDENFRVQSGFIYVNTEGAEGSQRLFLNSSKDEIYSEIKGKHISSVFHLLSTKAKELQSLSDRKNTGSIEEMKQFVSQDLKKIQTQQKSLALHISACELIMKRQSGLLEEFLSLQRDVMANDRMKEYLTYLEDSMARRFDMYTVLRLLCLYAIMQDGLPEKDYLFYSKQFLQAYGYKHLTTLHLLRRMELFYQRDSKIVLDPLIVDKLSWPTQTSARKSERIGYRKVSQRLDLLPSETSPNIEQAVKNGKHPSYVFGGVYIPLVYQLVEKCFKEREPSLGDFARCFGNNLRITDYSGPAWSKMGKILVLFLGGVTMAEVATLELLSQQLNRSIVVATTSTITAQAFMEIVSSQKTQ